MFSTHVAILAHGEDVAQVSHSFHAIEARLGICVQSALDALEYGYPSSLGEGLGEGLRLIKPAFSQSRRMKRNRYEAVGANRLYPRVLHSFQQEFQEYSPKMEVTAVLVAVDQVSQYSLCLVDGHYAVECQRTIFTVRA